jgi:N-acyl-D-aspartate/D-glutamate deacylase
MSLAKTKIAALLVALCCSTAAVRPAQDAVQADTVIKGGTIYTGGEDKPFVGDVAIKNDRIVYVGPTKKIAAKQTIDARGMAVSPGFIDPHTHPDTFIRSDDPAMRVNAAWLRQGVTTLMIGVDGHGTPDIAQDVEQLIRSGIGTNVAPFVGFGPVRQRVLKNDDRVPTAAELDQMKALVRKGMCEGALGFSTGLFYAPQSFAKTEEVIALAKEAGSRGGIYDSHQRDESSYTIGLLGSVAEGLRIGKEAGMPVHFAHIKALGVDVHGKAGEVIAEIERARAAGQQVTADQYPWLASGSSLDASLLPRWSVDGGSAKMLERFDDPALLAKIKVEMRENMRRRGGAGALLLIAQNFPWTGKTLEQVAAGWSIDPIDAALRIIRDSATAKASGTRISGGTSVASFNMDDADVAAFMKTPWVVTSSDGSDGHPRMFATFPEKYAKYVQQKKVISFDTFIRQSTGRTADIYKLDKRGYLKTGYFADVLVLDPKTYAPKADYVNPRELSVGVKALFVNGQLSVKDSATTGIRAGRGLLRPTPANCS